MNHKFLESLIPDKSLLLDLHTAASIGCEERVIDIIESVDDKSVVNLRNSSGWTPLMYAVCCTNLRIIAVLLEEGACTDIKNPLGQTAVTLASKCGSTDAVNMLIQSGASINDKDYIGWSAICYAAALGHRSVVQVLMENGAISTQLNKQTSLTAFPSDGQENIAKDLLHLDLNPSSLSRPKVSQNLAVQSIQLPMKNTFTEQNYQSSQSDLANLLAELKLSKYFHVFERHGIDISMFWMLTEDDLREMGIQLVGPRKKICTVISDWYKKNLAKGYSDDRTFSYKLILEYRKLQQQKDELDVMLSREAQLRKTAENSLKEGIKTLKNFSDSVQHTMAYTMDLEENLKQSIFNLKSHLCSTHDATFTKFKNDIALPMLHEMEKLLDNIHHYSYVALQQTSFRK